MRIHFPRMHPALVAGPAIPGALRFDPGYAPEAGEGAFRPGNLPLDPVAARRLVADAVGYGEQFRSPGEMAWHGFSADQGKPEAETAIRAELMARVTGSDPKRNPDPAPAQAQFVLLLAWHLEERLAELVGLEAGLEGGRKRFDDSLGLAEGEEAGALPLARALSRLAPGVESDEYPWRPALEAMCLFLPEGAELVVSDPAVLAAFEEAGAVFEPLEQESDLPVGTRRTSIPLGRLLGRSGSKDLLKRTVTVLAVPDGGENREEEA